MTVDRILVTHAGALPRSDKLNKVFRSQGLTAPVDKAALAADVKAEVAQVVRQQIECGVDSVNDGELSKSNFLFYVLDRISGIALREVDPANAPPKLDISGRDRKEFPDYFAAGKGGFSDAQNKTRMFCTTDLRYVGGEMLKTDLENFRNALKGVEPASAFLPALAPGTIEHWLYDEHYGDKEKFLFGIADAMGEEYRAIVEAGFILQIDDPDLPDGWQMFPEMTVAQYRDYAALRVAALNRALKGLPKDRIRLHVCWGSAHGPHHQDIPLADIIDTVFSVHAGQYSIEAANPMHEHEWRVFEKAKLPPEAILIPGVVGHCTDFIEHRELVAQRLVNYAKLVGRERVMAGTDCGLGWRVGHPSIAWGKLKSMAEGAALATKELWDGTKRTTIMKKFALTAILLALAIQPALAQKKYDPGASDTEVKVGGSGPFSGPGSVAGQLVKSVAAYFDMVNANGGINGRKITYIAEDDGYAPPKAVEVTRKLVEQDQVLFMGGSIGTPTQLAIRGYLNDKKIPQLFISSGNRAFYDPKISPWSLGNSPTNFTEGRLIGKYIEQAFAGKKIAVLYQNDDLGKDYLAGIKETTGTKTQIVAAVSYEITDPTVDSQIATLQASGAEVFASFSTPKATSQAIRRAFDTGWKPQIIIPLIVAQIDGTLRPAGLDKATGVISEVAIKDAADPQWAKDPDMIAFQAWRTKYNSAVPDPALAASGYNSGYMISQVIKQAGDDLTRENIMKQASNLKNIHPPMNLPGINVETTPDNFRLARKVQFQKFNGTNWELIGSPVSD